LKVVALYDQVARLRLGAPDAVLCDDSLHSGANQTRYAASICFAGELDLDATLDSLLEQGNELLPSEGPQVRGAVSESEACTVDYVLICGDSRLHGLDIGGLVSHQYLGPWPTPLQVRQADPPLFPTVC
jgi:hypothetical protein